MLLIIRRLISLSDFQTSNSVAAYVTLDTEQLISHTRIVLDDTFTSLQVSDRELIPVSEVHDLLNIIHGILDNAVPIWVSNTTHYLVYLFLICIQAAAELNLKYLVYG